MASTHQFEIEAIVRHDMGKGASRRLRREEKVPGVIYGAGKEPVSLTFEHKILAKALESEAFYSHILTLKVNGEMDKVILKAVQRHPYKPRIQHVDFLRIKADVKLHMHIPLHFTGEAAAPGLEAGGAFSHLIMDVEVACLPADLPEFISVDLSKMELNDTLHLSNLTLPKGVELIALGHDDDKAVVSLHLPRVEEEPEEAEEVSPEVPASEQKAEGEGSEEA